MALKVVGYSSIECWSENSSLSGLWAGIDAIAECWVKNYFLTQNWNHGRHVSVVWSMDFCFKSHCWSQNK